MNGQAGPRTALVVEVPEADPVVGELRLRHDPVAARSMPAHVTVLYPFLPVGAITPEVLGAALDVIGDLRPFAATFGGVATFPGRVAYLAPDPPGPFVALTRALVEAFPDCQPYGGQYDEVVPHLTIGHADDDAVFATLLDQARAAVAAAPVATRVEAVSLFSRDDEGRWLRRTAIPLGTDPSLA